MSLPGCWLLVVGCCAVLVGTWYLYRRRPLEQIQQHRLNCLVFQAFNFSTTICLLDCIVIFYSRQIWKFHLLIMEPSLSVPIRLMVGKHRFLSTVQRIGDKMLTSCVWKKEPSVWKKELRSSFFQKKEPDWIKSRVLWDVVSVVIPNLLVSRFPNFFTTLCYPQLENSLSAQNFFDFRIRSEIPLPRYGNTFLSWLKQFHHLFVVMSVGSFSRTELWKCSSNSRFANFHTWTFYEMWPKNEIYFWQPQL